MEAFIGSAGLNSGDIDWVYAKATQDRLAAPLSRRSRMPLSSIHPQHSVLRRLATRTCRRHRNVSEGFSFYRVGGKYRLGIKRRDVLLGYIKAYSRAVAWLYDPKNKDQAVDILVKYSKQDRKDSADTYDYFVNKLHAFSANGKLSAASYKKMTDALVSLGQGPPDTLATVPAADQPTLSRIRDALQLET